MEYEGRWSLSRILDHCSNLDVALQTGLCIRVLDTHLETVTALAWLPDGSGFISGGLDRKIILWVWHSYDQSPENLPFKLLQDMDGKQRDTWGTTSIRVTDLAVTPDFTRLVAVGMHQLPPAPSVTVIDLNQQRGQTGEAATPPTGGNQPQAKDTENRMIIYDLATKQIESYVIVILSGVVPF